MPRALVTEILNRLDALPNRTVPEVRVLRREYSKRLASANADEVIAIATALSPERGTSTRLIASELIASHREAIKRVDAMVLDKLGEGFDSWAAVDIFGCLLSGPAWRDGQVPDRLIAGWSVNADHWWRRAALVSTVALSRRGAPGDTERTLAICSRLTPDRYDMVVKALSWALRELTKTDKPAVEQFIAERGRELAPRVIREVNTKLKTGRKNNPPGKKRAS